MVRLLLIVVAVSLTAPSMASPAEGVVGRMVAKTDAKTPELSSGLDGLTGSAFSSDMVDGAGFIEKMLAASDSLSDYSFEYTMNVFKNKKTVVEEGVFYFKKPHLIRLEETGDYKRGAVAILGVNGKVKAHLGGGLKMFVVELEPASNLLRSANGHPMVESDFHSLSMALKQFLRQGVVSQVTKDAVELKQERDRVFILELRRANAPAKLWKRVAVSARTHLPVQWWDYDDDGDLWSHATWNSFKPNQQLADSLFDINGDKDSEKTHAGRGMKREPETER